ncbi:MAG: thymidylate kinase [Evtepia sp.]|nr:thymidylate kinase [Evtepia sp.]
MEQKKGTLIVFEGTDGSGKSTQFSKLCKRLEEENRTFRRLVFPQYEEESSTLIRMYLRGEFGLSPSDVNPYAASAFYAVDRYASFKKVWESDYCGGGLMLADRYTTSNAVHQAAKLQGTKRSEYVRWLFEFEYERMALPSPDLVLYLDLATDKSVELIERRQAESGNRVDIHEADRDYLTHCRQAALETAADYGWRVISCLDEQGELRSVEEIHAEVWQAVLPYLE